MRKGNFACKGFPLFFSWRGGDQRVCAGPRGEMFGLQDEAMSHFDRLFQVCVVNDNDI